LALEKANKKVLLVMNLAAVFVADTRSIPFPTQYGQLTELGQHNRNTQAVHATSIPIAIQKYHLARLKLKFFGCLRI